MKKINFSLLSILVFSISLAQNVKIKTNSGFYKYDIYSELTGLENHKVYHVKISDFKGINYSYSEGTDERAKSSDVLNQSGIIYGKKWNYLKYDLIFEVSLLSSDPYKNEVKSYKDESMTAAKYTYSIKTNQKYLIKIIDAKNNNQLLKEFTLDVAAEGAWPGYASPTVGYGSAKLLEDNYKNQQATQEGFFRKIDATIISYAFRLKIADQIEMAVADSQRKLLYGEFKVKTKDTKFDLLDSAAIYLEQGFDLIKQNDKAGIKGNHNVANAKSIFEKAYNIYSKYSSDEFVNWFTEPELKDEYIWALKSNLYLAAFLKGDYELSSQIYAEIEAKLKAEIDALKGREKTVKELMNPTSADNAIQIMREIRPMELREKRLAAEFKQRFGY